MILSSDPGQILDAFFEGYSIDRHLSNFYERLLKEEKKEDFIIGDDEDKEIYNLKLFLYFINNLMVNDRVALLNWRRYEQFVDYEFNKQVSPQVEKAFSQLLKNEAIHVLMKSSGSHINNLLFGLQEQVGETDAFEKELNNHAK